MHAKVLQSCHTLCDSMDCSPPGSSVCGILQARLLEWVDIFKMYRWISLDACLYSLKHHHFKDGECTPHPWSVFLRLDNPYLPAFPTLYMTRRNFSSLQTILHFAEFYINWIIQYILFWVYEDIIHSLGKNIGKVCTWQGLVSRMYEELS